MEENEPKQRPGEQVIDSKINGQGGTSSETEKEDNFEDSQSRRREARSASNVRQANAG